jgi:hypothetical protein
MRCMRAEDFGWRTGERLPLWLNQTNAAAI